MGNYCSIYHADFDKLVSLTNNYNKAVFLDKCIFWWQASKYTLNDGKIWFTRKVEDIARALSISASSVNRYLNSLEQLGFIERISKLSASSKGTFKVTKRLYIHITDKLLALLKTNHLQTQTNELNPDGCFFSAQDDIIETVNLTESIYKEKDYTTVSNSTVSEQAIVNNSIKNLAEDKVQNNFFPIEQKIGERLTTRLKHYIKGMLINMQHQHALTFSNPEKLFAEVVFSVTQETQWDNVPNPHHRVNIIAKLLRAKLWRTPKGFYNHWDVGQHYRKQEDAQLAERLKHKMTECQTARAFNQQQPWSEASLTSRFAPSMTAEKAALPNWQQQKLKTDLTNQWREVCGQISTEERYLNDLEQWQLKGKTIATNETINAIALKIAGLYEKKSQLAEDLKQLDAD